MERGSLLIDSPSKAYLWVHGSMLMPFGPYYQGKRRVPSPMVIKRHYGSTNIDILAQEILGLSKWITILLMYTRHYLVLY